ncbi:MAG: hypothetical protein KKC75_06290 [Nanoarchaeota archaeon]|nr:hypothetical protein [Nanoarchaeota archaeon]MBU1946134.1 hypothetical protein [Nanoarchaeota archaeon]
MDVFQKAKNVIKIIQKEVNLDKDEIKNIVSRLIVSRRDNKKEITKTDVMVFEILLKNKFNLNTVYRWLLVTNSPKDIQRKLRNGEISIREALHYRNKIRKQFGTNDSDFIKEVIWYVEEYII